MILTRALYTCMPKFQVSANQPCFKFNHVVKCIITEVSEPPQSLVKHLKQQLGKKNMLFPKSHLHLSKVVGQGEDQESLQSDDL